jgi:Zn-finger nucleic acid-binding protein
MGKQKCIHTQVEFTASQIHGSHLQEAIMESLDDVLVQVELKYCERCGGLWLPPKEETEIYCLGCVPQMAELPRGRRKRGFRPKMADYGSGLGMKDLGCGLATQERSARKDREEGGEEVGEGEKESCGKRNAGTGQSAGTAGAGQAIGGRAGREDDECGRGRAAKGHVSQLKCLFEVIGLYPAEGTTEAESVEGNDLAKTLLARLEFPHQLPADEEDAELAAPAVVGSDSVE